MMSTPYSWASRVKVMNCLGLSATACCAPGMVGMVPGVRSFMASIPETSVKFDRRHGAPFRQPGKRGRPPQATDIEDQRDPPIAQHRGAADTVDRAVIRLQAFHHHLLLAQEVVDHEADPIGTFALHDNDD